MTLGDLMASGRPMPTPEETDIALARFIDLASRLSGQDRQPHRRRWGGGAIPARGWTRGGGRPRTRRAVVTCAELLHTDHRMVAFAHLVDVEPKTGP